MFHVRHWTDCLQEAGAGSGDSFQRNSGVPDRWREAAAQGTHFQLYVSLRMTASHSSDRSRAIILCFLSTKCLPIRKSYLRDAFSWCTSRPEAMIYILKPILFGFFFPTQMIKSLKKTMSPVLSDISIEWLFPETKEVLLSPVGNTFLFPGDSLIGYSVVCDTTRYHANPKSVSARRRQTTTCKNFKIHHEFVSVIVKSFVSLNLIIWKVFLGRYKEKARANYGEAF